MSADVTICAKRMILYFTENFTLVCPADGSDLSRVPMKLSHYNGERMPPCCHPKVLGY